MVSSANPPTTRTAPMTAWTDDLLWFLLWSPVCRRHYGARLTTAKHGLQQYEPMWTACDVRRTPTRKCKERARVGRTGSGRGRGEDRGQEANSRTNSGNDPQRGDTTMDDRLWREARRWWWVREPDEAARFPHRGLRQAAMRETAGDGTEQARQAAGVPVAASHGKEKGKREGERRAAAHDRRARCAQSQSSFSTQGTHEGQTQASPKASKASPVQIPYACCRSYDAGEEAAAEKRGGRSTADSR